MAKEGKAEQRPLEPDGFVELAVRKREGRVELVERSWLKGQPKEEVIKSSEDKRIVADWATRAVLGRHW